MGEVVDANRMATTPYQLNFRTDRKDEVICEKTLSDDDMAKFRKVSCLHHPQGLPAASIMTAGNSSSSTQACKQGQLALAAVWSGSGASCSRRQCSVRLPPESHQIRAANRGRVRWTGFAGNVANPMKLLYMGLAVSCIAGSWGRLVLPDVL
jgi:hypothetical protein